MATKSNKPAPLPASDAGSMLRKHYQEGIEVVMPYRETPYIIRLRTSTAAVLRHMGDKMPVLLDAMGELRAKGAQLDSTDLAELEALTEKFNQVMIADAMVEPKCHPIEKFGGPPEHEIPDGEISYAWLTDIERMHILKLLSQPMSVWQNFRLQSQGDLEPLGDESEEFLPGQ